MIAADISRLTVNSIALTVSEAKIANIRHRALCPALFDRVR